MKKKQAIRQAFRDVCLKRDNRTCKCCGDVATEVHHVTDRSELAEDYKYVKENGISVCNPCHQKAEKFHISGGKEWIEGYHPNDLYKLIGSSWEIRDWGEAIHQLDVLYRKGFLSEADKESIDKILA